MRAHAIVIMRRMTGARVSGLALIPVAGLLALLAVGVAFGEQSRNLFQRLLDPLGIALLLAGALPVATARRWPVAAYLISLIAIAAHQIAQARHLQGSRGRGRQVRGQLGGSALPAGGATFEERS